METYASGCRALRSAYAEPAAETFHKWRKRTKYHRQHTRLLRDLRRPITRGWQMEVAALSDLLGSEHDLALFRATLLDKGLALAGDRDQRALLALIDQRGTGLRSQARPLGERIFAEKPRQLVRRFGKYWKIWHCSWEGAESFRFLPKGVRAASALVWPDNGSEVSWAN